jgi:hypothetical protein
MVRRRCPASALHVQPYIDWVIGKRMAIPKAALSRLVPLLQRDQFPWPIDRATSPRHGRGVPRSGHEGGILRRRVPRVDVPAPVALVAVLVARLKVRALLLDL